MLDPETVRLLRRHERAQRRPPGERWSPTSPIFTLGSGPPVQPSHLTHRLHAGIVLTADTHVSVSPQLYHDSACATARLVSKAVRATNRKISKTRETTLLTCGSP
ncbi:hypothetical protein AB0L05_24020 [Nonomuraea pusilla]|uniref:hypothetical protein n=1 Tax=Nonomuraea pusilla TaxID=46177 RepID=UPI003325B660